MQVDIGPDGFQSCCRFVTIIPPNRGKTGCQDEIRCPDCLDMVSGQFLEGDCLRESNHLDAAGARGSNPPVPVKNIEARSARLTKNLSQRPLHIIQSTGSQLFIQSQRGHRAPRGRSEGFRTAAAPLRLLFAGEPDQGPRRFQHKG